MFTYIHTHTHIYIYIYIYHLDPSLQCNPGSGHDDPALECSARAGPSKKLATIFFCKKIIWCFCKSSPRRRCHRASSARCFREFSESTVALSLALVPGDPVVVAESVRSTNGGGTQLGPRRPRSSGTRVQIQGGGRRARWKKKRRSRCVGGSAGRAVSRAVGW